MTKENLLIPKIFRSPLTWFLTTAFLLRIALAPFGTLELDFLSFLGWSQRLVTFGFSSFYDAWSDYLPGYLYLLWFLGGLKNLAAAVGLEIQAAALPVFFKLPAILADLVTGFLVYKAAARVTRKQKLALVASAAYLFNPAVFANSSLWGQVDGFVPLFALACLLLLSKNLYLSSSALALGTLFKPQVAFIAPLVLFLVFKKEKSLGLAKYAVSGSLVFLIPFLPFSLGKPFLVFVKDRLFASAAQYPFTSVNAFNFWGLGGGWWRSDTAGLIPPQVLGLALFAGFVLVALTVLSKRNKAKVFLATSFLFVASFLFLTRMHERHLLPTLAPLSVAAAANPLLFLPYATLSLTYLANLYFSYVWINQDFKMVFSQSFINLAVLANFASFGVIAFSLLETKPRKLKTLVGRMLKTKLSKISFLEKNSRLVLAAIVTFALVSRLFALSQPQEFYFDEVYHAFTAREMLRGNPAAWEWWTTPPEGFAYEWTHPPLAKLGMTAGMFFLGENPLAWRLPGALLGAGSVLLVYFLGLALFKSQTLSLFSSAVFALDGLPLVMSRIGMNDVYFLFFALATIYFFLVKKPLWSAAMLGLSFASKWTAFWLVPILVGGFFLFKRKPKPEYLFFLVIPPILYFLSYLPFFLGGHNLGQFLELQKQMWWYHTGLAATHPFQSSWWSWPILARPIWLFTQTRDLLIANIYAMGNPLVFWSGLFAVLLVSIKAVVDRERKLLFLTVAYLGFFLPWSVSPRILFLYHYLPSLPFLALATGWLLSSLALPKNRTLLAVFFLLLVASFVFFYPHWIGIFVPRWLDNLYYWLPGWR